MGDLIAVMREGRLEQLGSPHELYNRPATAFVAGFIGDPPMSPAHARLSEQNGRAMLEIAAAALPLPDELSNPAMPSSWTGRHPHRGWRPASGLSLKADGGKRESSGGPRRAGARKLATSDSGWRARFDADWLSRIRRRNPECRIAAVGLEASPLPDAVAVRRVVGDCGRRLRKRQDRRPQRLVADFDGALHHHALQHVVDPPDVPQHYSARIGFDNRCRPNAAVPIAGPQLAFNPLL
jgi:hypothetical protein